MILIHVEEDEELAFVMFVKLLGISNWRGLYLYQTPKLFELTKIIQAFITKELPALSTELQKHNVILESLFASPFLTIFSNLIPMEVAIKVLDRFILCN